MDSKLYEQARFLVCDTLEVAERDLEDDTLFVDDLGIDSILIIELKTRFEEKFGIRIPKDDLENLSSLNEIVVYLEQNNVTPV